jgi:flagellar protein FlaJ
MYSGMILYTYVFTPMLSLMFIYLAHSMQPKTPITEMRPYKAFAICSGIAAIVFILLTNGLGMIEISFMAGIQQFVDLPMAVAITLFITVAPPALVQGRISRKRLSMEQGISNFLRDLTEVRKTGLSPEKCIESLSERDYGEFTKELKRISSEISWGIPVRKVIMNFVKRTRSWVTQIVMFLLVETIDVGGGTISMIESLTRFNSLTQEVEKQKKMAVRPYVMIPYFSAILLVATTIMTLSFTSATLEAAESQTMNVTAMTTIFTASTIMHSYLIGLVAGKISEESVAAGFKHSAVLVILAILAAKVVPLFL